MKNNISLKGPSILTNKKPQKLVILFHGYGDNADNFISVVQELHDPESSINYFAPNAPSSVPQYPLGYQWFELYPNGINFNEAGPEEKKLMKDDCMSSLKLIKDYIINLCKSNNLNFEDCFIIGFSQGAMIAYEFGKYLDKKLAGCCLLSGRILPSNDHKRENFKKTPILLIHGDQDNILEPKYYFEALKILKNEGYLFEKYLLEGEGHTISFRMIQLIKNFIKKTMT